MEGNELTLAVVGKYLKNWLNTEPVKEEPAYHIFGNVALYDKPYRVDELDFCVNHLDCDALVLRDSFEHAGDEQDIVVFAVNREGNEAIDYLVHSELGEEFGRLIGIDKDELISI